MSRPRYARSPRKLERCSAPAMAPAAPALAIAMAGPAGLAPSPSMTAVAPVQRPRRSQSQSSPLGASSPCREPGLWRSPSSVVRPYFFPTARCKVGRSLLAAAGTRARWLRAERRDLVEAAERTAEHCLPLREVQLRTAIRDFLLELLVVQHESG